MKSMSRMEFVISSLKILNKKVVLLFICKVVPLIVSLGLAALTIIASNYIIGENPINGLLGAFTIYPTYVTVQFYIASWYKRTYEKLIEEFEVYDKRINDELIAFAAEAFKKSDLGRGHHECD